MCRFAQNLLVNGTRGTDGLLTGGEVQWRSSLLTLAGWVWTLACGLSVYGQVAGRLGLGDLGLSIQTFMSKFTPFADRLISAISSYGRPLTPVEGDVIRTVVLFGGLAIASVWGRWGRLGAGRLLIDAAKPTPLASAIALFFLFAFGSTVFMEFMHIRQDLPIWMTLPVVLFFTMLLFVPFMFLSHLRTFWTFRATVGKPFIWAVFVGLFACLIVWVFMALDNPPFLSIGFLLVYASMFVVLLLAPAQFEIMGSSVALVFSLDFAIWAHRLSLG